MNVDASSPCATKQASTFSLHTRHSTAHVQTTPHRLQVSRVQGCGRLRGAARGTARRQACRSPTAELAASQPACIFCLTWLCHDCNVFLMLASSRQLACLALPCLCLLRCGSQPETKGSRKKQQPAGKQENRTQRTMACGEGQTNKNKRASKTQQHLPHVSLRSLPHALRQA
jgi:hypothetical protein